MKQIRWTIISLLALVVHILVGMQLPLFFAKPHLVLVISLILVLRNHHIFLVFLTMILGAVVDSLSHQEIGVYALSWLLIASLAYASIPWIDTESFGSLIVPIMILLFLEKVLSLTLLNMVIPETKWHLFLFQYSFYSLIQEFFFLIINTLLFSFIEKSWQK